MLHRPLALLAGVVVALALAGSAAALTVQVRVEGLSTTIFGATESSLTPFTGVVVADDGSQHELARPTALGALEAASRKGEFLYRLRQLSFGLFVDRIGRYPGSGSSGWVYKVNGASPPVGASEYVLEEGDTVLWYFAKFGLGGGPRTLELRRLPDAGGCVAAFEASDSGASRPARNIVFKLDARSIRSATGRLCPTGHWHTLRATKPGAIRSQVLRAA